MDFDIKRYQVWTRAINKPNDNSIKLSHKIAALYVQRCENKKFKNTLELVLTYTQHYERPSVLIWPK